MKNKTALISLTPREVSHILAALRKYQADGGLEEIATDAGKHTLMTSEEIDDLCVKLNVSPKVGDPPRRLQERKEEVEYELFQKIDQLRVERLLSVASIFSATLSFIIRKNLGKECLAYLKRRFRR